VEAARALERAGATTVSACVTHPILSGPAISRIASSCLQELLVTDTIPLGHAKRHQKITVISVAPLLSEAIARIHYEQSISTLFDGMPG
jgi:ribose-phosphate pyrophosphokinase